MTILSLQPRRVFKLFVLFAVFVVGSFSGAQVAGADVLNANVDDGGPGASATEEAGSGMMIEELGLVPTNDGSSVAVASAIEPPDCSLLSVSTIDPTTLRRGYEVGYEEYPVTVALSCGTLDESQRALDLIDLTIASTNDPIATTGLQPR